MIRDFSTITEPVTLRHVFSFLYAGPPKHCEISKQDLKSTSCSNAYIVLHKWSEQIYNWRNSSVIGAFKHELLYISNKLHLPAVCVGQF